jgi:hypothetical protein
MWTRRYWAVPLVALLSLPACTQGSGPVVERTRQVASFSSIEAGAGIRVVVHIGPTALMVVRAQENIQDMVTTGVRDGTLRIEASGNWTVTDPVVVEVTAPSVTSVALSGGAAIEVSDLDVDTIDVSLAGGAQATISGTAKHVTLAAKGGSVAALAGLAAVTVTVDLQGGATAEVQASTSVRGSASGGAKLSVTGDGSVNVDASGGARVSRR